MTHPNVTHWDDVEAEEVDVGQLRGRWRDLGSAAGSFRAGVSLVEVVPGARSTPAHAHADEELFYVLAGSGLSWQDGTTHAIAEGDCLLHRVHEEAHTLIAGAVGLQEVPPEEHGRGRVRQEIRRVGKALGAETTGMQHVRIAPGANGTPHHCHGAEEELFVVVGGAGEVRLGEDRLPVARGSVVARPPGTGVAHSFVAGDRGLELLGWATHEPNDIAYYPDSGKVYLRGVGVVGRLEPADYWDGEE